MLDKADEVRLEYPKNLHNAIFGGLKVAVLRHPSTLNYPVLSVRYEIDSGYTFSGG